MAKKARDVMSGGVECAGENETVTEAAKKLAQLDVGSMPICGEDGRLKGMITDRDIRSLLGLKIRAPFENAYCGRGKKGACQQAVWGAIAAAGAELEAEQGTADPNAWRADATAERISFIPGLLPTTLRYTNRPSGIQQVISFKGHR